MKRTASILLTLALCLGLCVPASAAGFSDVSRDHYAAAAIDACVAKGIVSGYADGTFKPANPVTRAQFCVMLVRAFCSGGSGYHDTEENRALGWFVPASAALYFMGPYGGILEGASFQEGYSDSAVMNQPVNRYDMALLMGNILSYNGETVYNGKWSAAYSKIGDWSSVPAGYQDPVAACYSLGILTGQSDGTFGGNNTMNRAQACAVIDRLAKHMSGEAAAPAETPAPTSAVTLADGSEITEENVRRLIEGLKAQYPEGMRWTNENSHYSQALRITGYGCAGFAFLCSDTAFGDLPSAGTHSDFDRIRVGDIIRMNHDTHSVVVLEKNGDRLTITEGNFNSSVHWGRTVSRSELVSGNFVVTTRYPG